MTSDLSPSAAFSHLRPKPLNQLQIRALHSSAGIGQQDAGDESLVHYQNLDSASVEPRLQQVFDSENLQLNAALSSTEKGTTSRSIKAARAVQLNPTQQFWRSCEYTIA
jgi:hypothetical protein